MNMIRFQEEDGKPVIAVVWNNIPRVGETVLLHVGDEIGYTVQQVIWQHTGNAEDGVDAIVRLRKN